MSNNDTKAPANKFLTLVKKVVSHQMFIPIMALLILAIVNLAFDPNCNEISNMCAVPVYIGMMRQKAKIKVNEEGSEAAAVTVAGMLETSAMPREYPKATFHANRPFVYAIREASSGVILFVGKYTGE